MNKISPAFVNILNTTFPRLFTITDNKIILSGGIQYHEYENYKGVFGHVYETIEDGDSKRTIVLIELQDSHHDSRHRVSITCFHRIRLEENDTGYLITDKRKRIRYPVHIDPHNVETLRRWLKDNACRLLFVDDAWDFLKKEADYITLVFPQSVSPQYVIPQYVAYLAFI